MVRKSSTIHASENQIGKISISNDKNKKYYTLDNDSKK